MSQGAVALFTDFGTTDFYVGQMHAAVLDRAPGTAIVDLHHHAPCFSPGVAGLLLDALVPFVPRGAVVVGVVDPGVGTARGTLALWSGGHWFVGPDNGLFGPMAGAGDAEAYRLNPAAVGPLSASFHGRDLFAPAAAALVRGDRMVLGETVPEPVAAPGNPAQVVYVDHYGNLMTGLCPPGEAAGLRIGGRVVAHARTFGEVGVGELFWYRNSLDRVEVAARERSAGALLGVGAGVEVAWA